MRSWSLGAHLEDGDRPFIEYGTLEHLTIRPHGGYSIYPDITIFTLTPVQRDWAAAIARASAEFWSRHDANVEQAAVYAASDSRAEEDEANGQFGVGA